MNLPCLFPALQALAFSKQLMRGIDKEKLYAVNAAEVERLEERWLSDECMQAVVSFFQSKSKLWRRNLYWKFWFP